MNKTTDIVKPHFRNENNMNVIILTLDLGPDVAFYLIVDRHFYLAIKLEAHNIKTT